MVKSSLKYKLHAFNEWRIYWNFARGCFELWNRGFVLPKSVRSVGVLRWRCRITLKHNDPRWVGAWWVGYLAVMVVTLTVAPVFFGYPPEPSTGLYRPHYHDLAASCEAFASTKGGGYKNFDSTAIRPPFDSHSAAFRSHCDYLTTCIMTVGLPVNGLLHWRLNKQIGRYDCG